MICILMLIKICSGYMSPEYAFEGLFSEKSDVFSFGVLLLEIVSGRRNSSFHQDEESLSLLQFVSLSYFTITNLLTINMNSVSNSACY